MNDSRSLLFRQQDLRNRSFQGQVLNGADFTKADLRGCNFSHTQLVGANFTGAQFGPTNRQRGVWTIIAIATFLISGHAISNLVFGSLGQTPTDKAWNYVVALVISLSLAGMAPALYIGKQPFNTSASRTAYAVLLIRLGRLLAAIASGAVVGFFYAGILADKQPHWAIAGAVAGGSLAGISRLRRPSTTFTIMVHMTSAVAAYGLSFLLGATAISFVNTAFLTDGLLLGAIAALFLVFSVEALCHVLRTIRQAPGTHFRRANVTNACFTATALAQADFTNTLGKPIEVPAPESSKFSD